MPLNDSQRLCAEGFGASLAVIAGAGSGKTFTLKERIANAFDASLVDGKMEPLKSIEKVLAITFTEKAALELKGRIRSTLKSRGLADQALLVDTAWISTIHGMCSRILRENALELGIDPAFDVIADERREALLSQAIERVFQDTPERAKDVSLLFGEYGRETLSRMVARLVELAARSPEGFDALVGPEATPEGQRAAQELSRVVGRILSGGKDCPATVAEVVDFIDQCGPSGEYELGGETLAWNAPWGEGEYTGRQKVARVNHIALELRLIAASTLWEPLVRVAKAVEESFSALKRAKGALDNNDLLALAARALRREGIRARYADRFRLVMVDEFQDTDQTQLDIIRVLAGPDCERLCVVGDPQQSIYRFRGADLSVCEGHLATIPPVPDRQIHLDTNYRSHPDILDVVDVIFGEARGGVQDADVAAAEGAAEAAETGFYQRLVAGRSEERVPASKRLAPSEGPRVEIVDVEHPTYGSKLSRAFAADHIARRFEAIHEATGRPWSHMVILLGKMTNAQVYAEALDARGIPCAIAGGSVFARRSDVQVMLSLARVLANPRDGEALLSLLTSDIFGLSADDLLAMRELAGTRRLGCAFVRLMDGAASGEGPLLEPGSRLAHALACIGHAVSRAGLEGVARAMELLLLESGWLGRREAEGSVGASARAADALKLIRMVEDIEALGNPGARTVAEALAARLEEGKETPGMLQAERGDSVRIMTIHASKGLQFPIVAAAELEPGAGHAGKLTTQSSRGLTLASLDLERTLKGTDGRLASCAGGDLRSKLETIACEGAHVERPLDDSKLRRALSYEGAGSLAARDALIRAFGSDQDDLELERKIYVALTRAEEALIVCFCSTAISAELESRIKALPNDELGAKEALTTSKSRSKKHTPEEKAAAKEALDWFKAHLCFPFAGEPKGIPGRIRSRRGTIAACGYAYLHAPAAYVSRWAVSGELPPNWLGKGNEEGAEVMFDDAKGAAEPPSMAPLAELPELRELPCPRELRYAPQGPLGLLSASALHHAPDGAPAERDTLGLVFSDDDTAEEASATERGSAFHLMGEVAARRWKPEERLKLPEDRLAPTARLFGLSERQAAQLEREMGVWLGSDVAREMAVHARLEPEAPFAVELPEIEGRPPLCLTGFIDLLAYDERGRGPARVVDYKTGTFLDTDEARRAAYETQARCYAYALMCQGFSQVTLDFVFVDQPDAEGMPAICAFPAPGEPAWTMESLREYLRREVARFVSFEGGASPRVDSAASEELVADDWDINEGDSEITGFFKVD